MTNEMSILEKSSERQIRLALLLSMDHWNADSLADKIGVSKKTLMTDISAFNFSYVPAYITVTKHSQTILKLPPHLNLEDIIKKILNESAHINVLKMIFMEQPTLTALSKALYLSKASIRRIIIRINHYFQHKQLPITLSLDPNVQITGDEIYIRQFFCSMFRELYTPKQLPCFDMIATLLNRYFKKKEKTTEITTYKRIFGIYYLFTSIIRIGQGHLTADSQSLSNFENIELFYEIAKNNTVFSSTVQKKYNFCVNRQTISNLLSSNIQLLFLDDIPCSESDLHHLKAFTDYFYALLDIHDSLTPEHISQLQLFITFYKELQLFKTCYIELFFDTILKDHVDILHSYENSIVKFGFYTIKKKQLLYEELLLELITLSPALLNRLIPKTKIDTVLLLSYQEKRVSSLYKQLLLKKFPRLDRIDIYTDNVFTVDYRLLNDYDLVLTDVELETSKLATKILKISKIPTTSFWNNLEMLFHT
ncbi:M protein trans-acting positive regulator [Enterococcus faecalis 13-SD-W-01]|nr:M protein trans-acting positive regulator [Enterococcus faecalis 13-SD-W-01]